MQEVSGQVDSEIKRFKEQATADLEAAASCFHCCLAEAAAQVLRADFWEVDLDRNFSIFGVRRFTEWPRPLH